MGGGDGCRYVGVYLLWRLSQNCCSWGLRLQYCVGRVDLENRTVVYCGNGLDAWYVGGGGGCRCVGIDVSCTKSIAKKFSR